MRYVEYLQGDSNSYIDTGIYANAQYKYELQFEDTSINNYENLFGSSIREFCLQRRVSESRFEVNYMRTNSGAIGTYPTTKTIILVDKNKIYCNNTLIKEFDVNNNTTAFSNTTYLFDRNPLDVRSNAKVYYFKMWNENNELVLDFRPCLDDNNIPCMYDEVSGEYFYNQGSGTFGYKEYHLYLFANNNEGTAENLGSYRLYNMKIEGDSEGVESGVDYVDCLIGDGASYIDTGMTIQRDYKIEVTFMSTINNVGSTHSAIFGVGTPTYYSYDFNPPGISLWLESNALKYRNNGTTTVSYDASWYNKKYTQEIIAGDKVANVNNLLLFTVNNADKVITTSPYAIASNCLKIYDFKIYNNQGTLIQHLKPCLDTEGIPCMYDEVSKQYFYNQGTGTFGYKKKLRDFQPVLDSNGVPCLMDKINKKYYYDKNGNLFDYAEQSEYKRVGYIRGNTNFNIGERVVDNNMKIIFKAKLSNYSTVMVTHSNLNYCRIAQGLNYFGVRLNSNFREARLTGDSIQTVTIDKNKVSYDEGNFEVPSSEFSYTDTVSLFQGTFDIYYFKMYQSNELVLDLIPVLDNEGTPCLYDLVTETFFYNQGTGTFSYGIEEDECPKANYVEYLESNGTQYINTGMGVNANRYIEIDYVLRATPYKTSHAFGAKDNWGNSLHPPYWLYTTNTLAYDYFTNVITTDIPYTDFSDKRVTLIMRYNSISINGVTYENNKTTCGDKSNVPVYLFAVNQAVENKIVYPQENIIIYSYKLYDNDELIQELLPCLDDNNVPCMYDTISGEYFYNQGEGNFTYGKSIGYTPIKYIETNGTQYIDTGVVVNDNTYMDIDYRAVDKPYFQVGWKNSVDLFPNPNVEYILETDIKYLGQQQGYGAVIQTHSWAKFFGITAEGYYQIYDTISTTLASTTSYDKIKIKITNSAILLYVNDELTLEVTNSSIFGALLGGGSSNWALFRTHGVKAISLDGEVLYNCIPVLADTDITLSGKTSTLEGLPRIYEEINGTYTHIHYPDNLNYQEYTKRPNWDYGYDDSYLCNNMTLINTYKQVQYANANSDTNSFTIYDKSVYGYKETNTTVEPNLTASAGATLTLGSTYIPYLTESEIEQAIKNGWIIQ